MEVAAMSPEREEKPGSQKRLRLIGRRERVDFPEWGLLRVRAKVDTGAYSSALDVAGYELFEKSGQLHARLRLKPRKGRPGSLVIAPVVRMVAVTSSSGARQQRPLLEPLVRLGPITRRIRLTITDRARLRCPMLLGRAALAGLFLVDVSQKDLLSR
jgi:hypothetical protein